MYNFSHLFFFNFNGKNCFFPTKIEKYDFIDFFAHLTELDV